MSCFAFASAVVCCLNVRVGIHIDQLPQLGKTELCFLLPFTCDFVVSVKKILFLLVHGKAGLFYFDNPWSLNVSVSKALHCGPKYVKLLVKKIYANLLQNNQLLCITSV